MSTIGGTIVVLGLSREAQQELPVNVEVVAEHAEMTGGRRMTVIRFPDGDGCVSALVSDVIDVLDRHSTEYYLFDAREVSC